MTTCPDLDCNEVIPSLHRGGGAYNNVFSTGMFIAPTRSGNFTTDANGAAGTLLPQYIAPGWPRAELTKVCASPPCNWFPGTDPNVGLYRSVSNAGNDDGWKGGMETYNIDGMLLLGN
jgi:hypothetical protein